MSDLPFPPTPAECDLRGMPYMPLDIVRLFDSDLYILSTGDEFKAAVTLWGKAFLQVPAGSLADDDRILAHLSGSKCWVKVREMALRGWYKCTDGRLYHHTVAEKVGEAWEARQAQRQRTATARAARAAAHSGTPPASPATDAAAVSVTDQATEDVTKPVAVSVAVSVTDNVTGSKGREGKGREDKKERPFASLTPAPAAAGAADFDQFWDRYPRKKHKAHARKTYAIAVRKTPAAVILDGVARAAWHRDPQFIPYPATWLSAEGWLDEAPKPRDIGAEMRRALDLDGPLDPPLVLQ